MERELEIVLVLDNLQYISTKAKEKGMIDIAKDIENTKYILERIFADEINEIKKCWIDEIKKKL